MSARPVVMVLLPGRDALCLELSLRSLGALCLALALPFTSALTARALLLPSGPPASAMTAHLARATRGSGSAVPREVSAAPRQAASVEPLSGESDHEATHQRVVLSSMLPGLRARGGSLLAPKKVPEPVPEPREDAAVIRAKDVARAFERRREQHHFDAAHADELAHGQLHIQAVHSGEVVHARPFDELGQIGAHPLAELQRLMRCRVTGAELPIDSRLVRLLTQLSAAYQRPLQLISGYRTPHTLGTAPTSQHALGRAADIRIRGVSLSALRKMAIELGARGVGLYPEKGFLHVDVRDKARYFWNYTDATGETQYDTKLEQGTSRE